MELRASLFGGLFTLVATGVLLYVSLTTGIGPWLAPTIILSTAVIFSLFSSMASEKKQYELFIIQTIAAVGGGIATVVGFALPTLYFLDKSEYYSFIKDPYTLTATLGSLVFVAGYAGMWFANKFAPAFLSDQSFEFPLSKLIHTTLQSQSRFFDGVIMGIGALSSWTLGMFRDGVGLIPSLLPRRIMTSIAFFGQKIPLGFEFSPVYWAIGFIAGTGIVLPFGIGMISKYLVVEPIRIHFFESMSSMNFLLAFCSGIVLIEALMGALKYPQILTQAWRSAMTPTGKKIQDWWQEWYPVVRVYASYELVAVTLMVIGVLSYFQFSLLEQLLLVLLSSFSVYHLAKFAVRAGLAPFGRFMTFVMLPMVVLFKLSYFKTVVVCLFVGVAGATAAMLLVNYHVGTRLQVSRGRVYWYQLFGVLITALSIGLFVYLLSTQFELGSADLCAYRGRSRALLLSSFLFDWKIIFIGMLYALLLRFLRLSPTMVFGGLLMPNQITIGLMFGAAQTLFFKKPEKAYPFWSGVFTGESVWILARLVFILMG